MGLWGVGIGLSAFASFLSALAYNLQKLSLMRSRKAPIRQPLWVLAMALRALASGIDLVALGLAPQVLIAALGSATIVFNEILASTMLGEHVGLRHCLASLAMVAGCALTVGFGEKGSPDYAVEDLLALFSSERMTIYAIAVICILLIHLACVGSISFGMRLQLVPCSVRPAAAVDKSSSIVDDCIELLSALQCAVRARVRRLRGRRRTPPRGRAGSPVPRKEPVVAETELPRVGLEGKPEDVEAVASPYHHPVAAPAPLDRDDSDGPDAVDAPPAVPALVVSQSFGRRSSLSSAATTPTTSASTPSPQPQDAMLPRRADAVGRAAEDWRLHTPTSPAPAEEGGVEGYRIPTRAGMSMLYMVSWCAIAGILGGVRGRAGPLSLPALTPLPSFRFPPQHIPLFIKCVIEIVKAGGMAAAVRVESYVLVFAVVVCAFGYLHIQNVLLRRYDAARAVSVISALWVTWGTASGLVYFDRVPRMVVVQVRRRTGGGWPHQPEARALTSASRPQVLGLSTGLVVNLLGIVAIGFAPDASTVASLKVARNELLDAELGEEDLVRFRRAPNPVE